MGVLGMFYYVVFKWVVFGFFEFMIVELVFFGISVICIEFGYFCIGFFNLGYVIWFLDCMEEVYKGMLVDDYCELVV